MIGAKFQDFIAKYSKNYANSSEFLQRFQTFSSNYFYVEKINRANLSYKLSMNFMADMSQQEIRESLMGYNQSMRLID